MRDRFLGSNQKEPRNLNENIAEWYEDSTLMIRDCTVEQKQNARNATIKIVTNAHFMSFE